MKHFYSFVSQVHHCWCHVAFLFICLSGLSLCPPVSVGHEAFLFICFPGPLLLVSALFRWPCSISIHLSPRCVTAGVRPFPQAMQHFYSFVSQVCHCWCPPFSSAMQHFYSLVSQVCHCWCPPFSAGDATFLFIGAAALFRWPCSISIHLSPM